jgi:hypothetical protein
MFFKKGRGRCGCVYGAKGAVDRKSLGTTGLKQVACVSHSFGLSPSSKN